jgi:hypothetical protein
MTRPHPATIALAVIAVVSALGLWWFAAAMQESQQNLHWEGDAPTAEVILAWAFYNFGYSLAMPALGMASVASLLGLVLAWCISRERLRRADARADRSLAERTSVPPAR